MSVKKRDCPVTERGCPPVIELTANMKWIVWGAKLSIVQFFGIVAALLVVLFKMGVGHMQANAVALEDRVQGPKSTVHGSTLKFRGPRSEVQSTGSEQDRR